MCAELLQEVRLVLYSPLSVGYTEVLGRQSLGVEGNKFQTIITDTLSINDFFTTEGIQAGVETNNLSWMLKWGLQAAQQRANEFEVLYDPCIP